MCNSKEEGGYGWKKRREETLELLNTEVRVDKAGWAFEQHSCVSKVLCLQEQSPKSAPTGLQVSFMARLLLSTGLSVLHFVLTLPHLAFTSRRFQLGVGSLVDFLGIPVVSFNRMVEKDREVGLCMGGVLLKTFGGQCMRVLDGASKKG